jgi:hypothetical protein
VNLGIKAVSDEYVSSNIQPADAMPVRLITRTDFRKSMAVIEMRSWIIVLVGLSIVRMKQG